MYSQCTYCACTDITVVLETYHIGQTPSSLECCLVYIIMLQTNKPRRNIISVVNGVVLFVRVCTCEVHEANQHVQL